MGDNFGIFRSMGEEENMEVWEEFTPSQSRCRDQLCLGFWAFIFNFILGSFLLGPCIVMLKGFFFLYPMFSSYNP